jgi:hypothetical protein
MKTLVLLSIACLLPGCAILLPSSQDKSLQPWTSFEEAKASYDKIEPFVTDLDTLRELGFDPFNTPNIKILNHAEVVQTVLPSPIPNGIELPPGIRECMKAQDACQGFYMERSRLKRRRVGNFFMDFMNFRRETITTGWKFGTLIVIVGNRVVYKQWSGSPNIQEESVQVNPLGPLQGAGTSSGLYD